MKLTFDLIHSTTTTPIDTNIDQMIIAGWAGRDHAAIEHHIEELAAIGVPRPSSVPLFYRVANQLLTQDATVQMVGNEGSGEVEVFVFKHHDQLLVSLTSDHTDRGLETVSVALSKQVCSKPVGRQAWLFSDVASHWDQLLLPNGTAMSCGTVGTRGAIRPSPKFEMRLVDPIRQCELAHSYQIEVLDKVS